MKMKAKRGMALVALVEAAGFAGLSEYATSVYCPALLVHGERDPRVKVTEARRVFDAIPGTKEFVTFERSGHEILLVKPRQSVANRRRQIHHLLQT